MGGLARRATHLRGIRRNSGSPVLVVGGPFELARPVGRATDSAKLPVLTQAYKDLDYDLGVIAPTEFSALETAGALAPPGWVEADKVRTRVLEPGGQDPVGVVVFPALPEGVETPARQTLDEIGRAVAKLRADGAKAVIGMSPWGYRGERAYVEAHPKNPVDLLLGAGPGIGFAGRVEDKGRIYWARPTYEGKAVLIVDIKAWPSRNGDFTWQPPDNIASRMEYLGDNVVPDANMAGLLSGISDN